MKKLKVFILVLVLLASPFNTSIIWGEGDDVVNDNLVTTEKKEEKLVTTDQEESNKEKDINTTQDSPDEENNDINNVQDSSINEQKDPNILHSGLTTEERLEEKSNLTDLNVTETKNIQAIIKMDYDGKTFSYFEGEINNNKDQEIYKTTKINWTSISTSTNGQDDIIEEEWINEKETYDSYGEQIVKLRVKDKSGEWSAWTEVKFNITNRPPVADLGYIVLNPESLVNGNVTTDTQIAWLWLYANQSFIYDPDGDEIVDIDISGINQGDIIQVLDGGTEFQGFATQFKSPGNYILNFKVQDSQGLWSDAWSIEIQVKSTVTAKEITITNVKSTQTPNGTFKFAYASHYPSIVLSGFMPADINNYLKYNDYGSNAAGSILETRWIDEEKARKRVAETVAIYPQVGPKFDYETYTLHPNKWDAVRVIDEKNLEIKKPLVKGGFTIEGKITSEGKSLPNKLVTATLFYKGNNAGTLNALTDADGSYKFTVDLSGVEHKETKYIYLSRYDTYYYDELDIRINCEGQEQIKTVLMETGVEEGYHFIGRDLIRKPGYSPNLGEIRPYDYWSSLLYWEYCQKYSHLAGKGNAGFY